MSALSGVSSHQSLTGADGLTASSTMHRRSTRRPSAISRSSIGTTSWAAISRHHFSCRRRPRRICVMPAAQSSILSISTRSGRCAITRFTAPPRPAWQCSRGPLPRILRRRFASTACRPGRFCGPKTVCRKRRSRASFARCRSSARANLTILPAACCTCYETRLM